ncbi:unnamed protein product [Moneuplotes crassus]|uniref:Tetraspanin family protein n=1 Tax=Euplotes crassus TaxID=5936 RepID=A0AAD1Y9Z3_EUPCR|nr:unnamed protein product [Moneuplotes crassus]
MCCIFRSCKVKTVKILLLIFSLLQVAGIAMFIYLVDMVKDSPIFGILFDGSETVETYLYYTCLLTLFYLIIITFCGVCMAFKRYGAFHYCFFIFLNLLTFYCIIYGAIIMGLSVYMANKVDETCKFTGSSDSLAIRLENVYPDAAAVFCTSSCPCYIGSSSYSSGMTYATTSSSGNKKVQECDKYLMDAYANYEIDFNDVEELKRYLGYYGQIEQEYKCSGICAQRAIYYFSDSSSGVPDKSCLDGIKESVRPGDFYIIGVLNLVTGILLFFLWNIQFGLCCRNNKVAQQNKIMQENRGDMEIRGPQDHRGTQGNIGVQGNMGQGREVVLVPADKVDNNGNIHLDGTESRFVLAGEHLNVYEDNKEGFPPIYNNPNNANPNATKPPNRSGGLNISRALNGGQNPGAAGKPSIVSSTIKMASKNEMHDNEGGN